jgi:replicative DNA helicase
MINDVAAERAVLAGICTYGSDAYLEICDFVKVDSFSVESNQVIFKCLNHILKDNNEVKKIDLPSIWSAAAELKLSRVLEKKEEAQHLNSILLLDVQYNNVRKFAAKLRRLQVARMIENQGEILKQKMRETDGTETIAQLLGMAEETIFDFAAIFDAESELKAKLVGQDVMEYVQYLQDNPVQQLGIPTGLPGYDESIGGGLNPGIAMIVARAKEGKTSLAINVAKNITKDQKIPVLYLDTEMVEKGRYKDVSNKLLACLSSVDVNRIKTGQFSKSTVERERVVEAAKVLEGLNLYRIDISGKPFEDIISCMRRWVQGTVGLNPDGTAKDCVIIYDYLKVMNGEGINDSMQEYQLLGIMMTAIQNFALRYTMPVLAFAQMNRGGLSSSGADTVAGSDRISWFCTSLTAFQSKSEEELAEQGQEMGNKKLYTILSRYGPGHDFGEYVNVQMNKYTAQIYEVKNPTSRNGFEDKVITSKSKDIPDDQMEHYENGESEMEQQITF